MVKNQTCFISASCLELTIGFLNVNGLHSKASSIKDTIVNNNLDIIGLSETMHRDSNDQCLSEVIPQHFRMLHAPRLTTHGGGLVILYMWLILKSITKYDDLLQCVVECLTIGFLNVNGLHSKASSIKDNR